MGRVSLPFQLTSEERRRLGYNLIDRIDEYFSSLESRSVQLPLERRSFEPLRNALPELGSDPARVLDDICSELITEGFHVPSANYFGLMNPTPTYMAVVAEALVAALNPQLATMARSQLASKIEAETVRWIGERVGWKSKFDGTFTSGGNEANFSALALALAAKFPQVMEKGIASVGARPVLYASEESHHSLDKSAGLLGLGRRALRRIHVNADARINVRELERAIAADLSAGQRPFCVVATAGTTNSGAIDDLEAIAGICKKYGLWMHVDGAYGAAAIFSDRHRNLVEGIEQSDSVTIDPHKWLAMPFAAGVVLTRHRQMLERAFGTSTPYMPRMATPTPTDNFKISTQWSRRMNSLKLWLTLRVHGRQAYEQLIERQLTLMSEFADWFRKSELFDLVREPQLPILNVRVRTAASKENIAQANAAVVEAVTRDGSRWISETQVAGESVIRIMIISYLTGENSIAGLQQAMTEAARTSYGARLPASASERKG